ncbi:Protein of unknown function [Cotesia congregata]|uniref:Uncharacterized protein n=1 Tax=Cotesia congregata TaxID=51543 RepID=A0A8J2MGA8_COTCN|nr:Protein of unknown function [Cotesia congregata]
MDHWALRFLPRKVNTKYGPKILGIVESEFSIFFPNRTNRMLIDDEEQLTSLIDLASAGELYLNYFGTAYHNYKYSEDELDSPPIEAALIIL